MDRKVHQYKNKMSLLQKCRWSLKGKGRVDALLKDLRKYNDDLVRLCSWEAQAQMNRVLPTFALPQCNNFLDLQFMADSAKDAAKDKSSPMAEGRERMADMARFKARMVTPAQVSRRFQARWRLLDKRDYVVKSPGPRALAISQQDQQVVFVEWQSYIGVVSDFSRMGQILGTVWCTICPRTCEILRAILALTNSGTSASHPH